MDLIDPHVHMVSRVTDDYERMALAGIRVVIEPAFWLGQARTHPGTFFDYFDMILEWETERARRYGIDHYVCLSVNPKEANDEALAEAVLARLPGYLEHPRVVGVGEIGFDQITDAEERVFRAQLDLARAAGLPVLIHLPHRNKLEGARRTLAVLDEVGFPKESVLNDHNTEETIETVRAWGGWAGHTIYNVTKLTPERAVNILDEFGLERMMINSSADWGPSDPLNVPKTVAEMRRRGYAKADIETIVWKNPIAFFGQTGRFAPRG